MPLRMFAKDVGYINLRPFPYIFSFLSKDLNEGLGILNNTKKQFQNDTWLHSLASLTTVSEFWRISRSSENLKVRLRLGPGVEPIGKL